MKLLYLSHMSNESKISTRTVDSKNQGARVWVSTRVWTTWPRPMSDILYLIFVRILNLKHIT